VNKGPIIFLKLAEGEEGQYDGIVYPTKDFDGLDSFDNTEGIFINYTRVQEVVGDKYNLVPRKQFCGARVGSDLPSQMRERYDDEYLQELESDYMRIDEKTTLPTAEEIASVSRSYKYQSCLMFFDTLMERKIDLGNRYTFDPMTQGECLVDEQLAESLKVEEGDVIYNKMDIYQNLIALIDAYNYDVVTEAEDFIPRDTIQKGNNSIVTVPCRVAHIGNQSYGKLPKEAIADQIIMEYGPFFTHLSNFLP
jgi:hypothetical protein